MTKIIDIRHPYWSRKASSWLKWRSVYCGGDDFIEDYTKKFSGRETNDDFRKRKEVTPSPSFAKSAINDIKNSIFQRTVDIVRRGGSDNYKLAVLGQNNGVDLHGASMNTYIGRELLPELLTMARVGVYVDMPPVSGPTLMEQQGVRPYLYTYKTEEILSWTYRKDRVDEFQSLLLMDWMDDYDSSTGMPKDKWCRYRHVWVGEDGAVYVQCYDKECKHVDLEGRPTNEPYRLDIDRIPFVILEITDSLLADVANHQIALLNLESSDMSYALKSNFPFYVEQVDPRDYSEYLKPESVNSDTGEAAETGGTSGKEIRAGATQGRTYGKGLDAPQFIAPPSEPLQASMAKQRQLKEDIRQLVNLALSQIQPKMASAESKALDERGLEAGLSYIGLELEHAERKIAGYWSMYEGRDNDVMIQYPKKYSLQSDEDRRRDVEQLEKLRDSVPSDGFQKSISKQMVATLLGHKLPLDEIEKMFTEIDGSDCYTANPEIIFPAIEAGVMPLEIAAKLLGLPKGAVEQASKDHAERLARISEAQAKEKVENPAARGVPEQSGQPGQDVDDEREDGQDTTEDDVVTDKVRGEGK